MSISPVTPEQKELIDRFLTAFNKAENHLRHTLKEEPYTPVRKLINQYGASRSRWREGDGHRLDVMRSLRNALVHTPQRPNEYLSVPVAEIVTEIEAICERLRNPLSVIPTFQRNVVQFAVTETLGTVLERIAEDDYSQFPIYGRNRKFSGLLTENGITRWLAKHIRENGMSLVEFEDALVEDVLNTEEQRNNWLFVAGTAGVPDVVELFTIEPFLEAVLITENGKKEDDILGIVTRWDIPNHMSTGRSD